MFTSRTAKSSLQILSTALLVVLGSQLVGCGGDEPAPAASSAPSEGGKGLSGPKASKEPLTAKSTKKK